MLFSVVAKSNSGDGVRIGRVSMLDASRKFGFSLYWKHDSYKYTCMYIIVAVERVASAEPIDVYTLTVDESGTV